MTNKFIYNLKNKLIFFTLISLSIITITSSSVEIIPKYGKKTTYNTYIYLDVSGFDTGDKIYISITTTSYANSRLDYAFCQNTDTSCSSSTLRSVYESSSSTTDAYYYEETFNYKIKKDISANYLYMKYYFYPPVTIENTEDDVSIAIIIISVVCSVVFLVIIIVLIICCCRRCHRARTYGTVPYPITTGYGVSPYVVQPVVQPVVSVQPYYNQVAPAPVVSDVRVNQI